MNEKTRPVILVRKVSDYVIAVKMAPNCVIASAKRVAISMATNGVS